MPIVDRFKNAWNAFRSADEDPQQIDYPSGGYSSYSGISPTRPHLRIFNERSIIGAIYTRLSIDVAAVDFRHVRLDDMGRYKEDVDSDLNMCLTFEPNMDQGPRDFRQNIALELFNSKDGSAALVPVDTTRNPNTNELFDVQTLRVGEILQWHPHQLSIDVYNEDKGIRQEVVLNKRYVGVVTNPFRHVMNEPNSTLQRLTRKLSLLDAVDEASGSGKLDIIIQLPYTIRSDKRRESAERRRADLEYDLKNSQYGVAYTDSTEKIIQLNRPAENNLLKQIEYLTGLLYNQLGLTEEIMNGTADAKTMQNYQNRTIEPIVDAIKEAMIRSFVGPEGVKQKETILYFQDPFKLIPVTEMADLFDKLSRNEVLSPNEIRGVVGFKPSADPKADTLNNSNMPEELPQ